MISNTNKVYFGNQEISQVYVGDTLVFGGETAWTPYSLGSSLALWLDASDSDSVIVNGNGVSQWNDKSGNERNLIQQTATSQPIYVSNLLNNKFGVRADGVDDRLVANSAFSVESITVFTVERWLTWNTGTQGYPNLWHTDLPLTAVSNEGMRKEQYNNTIYTRISTGTNSGSFLVGGQTSANSLNVANICASQFDRATTTTRTFFNGVLAQSATPTTIPDDFGGRFALFGGFAAALTSSPTRNANAEIFETVIVSAALSADNRQKLEGYLAHKWGLTANLPSDHPYKTVAP